jgi:hypothetical protein
MIRKLFVGVVAAAIAFAGATLAAELKSGPQTGEKVPGPFEPLNVTGSKAGEKYCLFCSNGNNPVIAIFARTPDCPATQKLILAVDASTAKNAEAKMGSFVVFLSGEEKLEGKLKEMADKAQLKKTVLSIDSVEGPKDYAIAKDADLTILLYKDRVVKANYSFEKGKISDKDIDTVIADVTKIVPAK